MPIRHLISVYPISLIVTAAELPSTPVLQQQNSSRASNQPPPCTQSQFNQFNYGQPFRQHMQLANEPVTLQQGKEVLYAVVFKQYIPMSGNQQILSSCFLVTSCLLW